MVHRLKEVQQQLLYSNTIILQQQFYSNNFTTTLPHVKILTICEFSRISVNNLAHDTVGTLPFFFSISFILATKSARFLRAVVDKPVVRMPTSILPDNGSVADCFNASRCNL